MRPPIGEPTALAALQRQLGALQRLAAWREREARRRDLPRSFVLKEDLLLALATRQPKTTRDLPKLPSYDARQGSRDAATWLEILEENAGRPAEDLPPRIARPPHSPAIRDLENRLRETYDFMGNPIHFVTRKRGER